MLVRGSLNDKFGAKTIYIGDGQIFDTTYIFTEAEEQDVWLDTELEPDTFGYRRRNC
jgi:hypothetical protein